MAIIRVVQIGLGPLGQKITRYLLERKDSIKIVGAVDVDPKKAGMDLGQVCGLGKKLGLSVVANLKQIQRNPRPDVALLTTVSDMKRIAPQIEEIVSHKIHVVTTCEELSFPWTTSPTLARRIDRAAKRNKVSVLATGVNPGFLMDFLPLVLTSVCQRVDRIKVLRIQDATSRRLPFQKKIGAGLTLEEFDRKRLEGTLRHVGLTQSISMIAHSMGWKLDKTEDVLTPIIAKQDIRTRELTIRKGMAAGVEQIGRGIVNGEEKITLIFCASVGEPGQTDTIEITGEPNVVSSVKDGIHGDIATCAIAINALRQVMRTAPGLHTMADVPVASYFSR